MSKTRMQQGRAAWAALFVLAAILVPAAVGHAAESDPGEHPVKIDLNRATAEELQALPGIGPALAERIVEYREENGPFQRIEDLMNVRGIGEKNFLKIRDLVIVKAEKSGEG